MSTKSKINSAPSGEFTVKQLAAHNLVSYVTAHQFVEKNKDKIQLVRTEKVTAGKGRKANVYTLVGDPFTKVVEKNPEVPVE